MRSKYEEKINRNLKHNGVNFEYETVSLSYTLEHKYTPDFILKDTGIYVESKGYFSRDDMRKMKKVIEQHPELDIRMLFQNASNKISKNSKMNYGQWCDRNNIKWAESKNGVIPSDWLK